LVGLDFNSIDKGAPFIIVALSRNLLDGSLFLDERSVITEKRTQRAERISRCVNGCSENLLDLGRSRNGNVDRRPWGT
jgi:hypothetical protein